MSFTGVIPPFTPVAIPQKPCGSPGLDNGHWEFPEQMGVGSGFIYVVYDRHFRRSYLGRKDYISSTVRHVRRESDWRNYMSSSNLLKEMLSNRPRSEFDFICLEQYKAKGTLGYAETWSLCYAQAPTNNLWYNKRIEAVSWAVKEPISARHISRLDEILRRMN